MSDETSTRIRQLGRRDFLKAGSAVTAALLAPAGLSGDVKRTLPALPSNPRTPAAMPTRNLGKTDTKLASFRWAGKLRWRSQTTSRLLFPSSSARWIWASTTSIRRQSMAVPNAGASNMSGA
jgi:hypothetical protein